MREEVSRLIAGLGNPGSEYERTYHNVGALLVEHLRSKTGGEKEKMKSRDTFLYDKDGPQIFVHPTTFMNDSGRAIRDALSFLKLTPDDLLVIHDDSDLPLGSYKFSKDQGSAGHKGIESIIEALGTKSFSRIRIGIRTQEGKAEEFVLKKITEGDMETLYGVFGAIEKFITNETPSGT